MGAPPLMTLRDLLELSCESSCSEGFRTYPRRLPWHGGDDDAAQPRAKAEKEDAEAPVRLLIEADLRRSPSRTLSSILFPRSPGSLATVSRLTRSLSRRLVFWRRHRGDDAGGSDSDERDSLGLPSPVVSSCSASECAAESEAEAEATSPLVHAEQHESSASEHSEKPSPSTSSGIDGSLNDTDDGAAAGDSHKVMDGDRPVESMEDKQQLSPVSVLDFPFHDEEDDGDERSDAGTCSCSPSFLHCQPDLQRSNSVLHKIRRLDLDGLAPQAGVDPRADLEPRFAASDDSSVASASDDTQQAHSGSSSSAATTTSTSTAPSCDDEQHPCPDDAERPEPDLRHRLLARVLKDQGGSLTTSDDVATERLLLEFFAEGLDRRRSPKAGPVVGTVKPSDHDRDEAALVRAAKEWVQGLGTRWGVEDVLFAGPAALADMDRERRWACVGEEQREVAATVEWLLMDALVAELVRDMAAGRC
uniref:Uncharacterized protein n=1 Tax=Avena sativa TaxID=4498 RepID=A0ACD5TTR3_AVESA